MAEQKKAAPTKESGTVFISSTGDQYTSPDITADLIEEYKENYYIKSVLQTQKALLFTEPAIITVTDADGNQDEDVERDITEMCDAQGVDINTKMQLGWEDGFCYGPNLVNPVWEYVGNIYTLLKLRHLPASSFDTDPLDGSFEIYSQLLRGITIGKDDEIKYYQVIDDSKAPVLLDNVTMIRDPVSSKLTGESMVVPLVGIVGMIKYTWDTVMQQVNRTGAKILFLKVTEPMEASTENGNVGDIEAAKLILANWGKDTAFPLRGNMEIIDPKISDDSNSLEIIDALNQMIIDFNSPINVLQSGNDGARLGGNDTERGKLIQKWIKSRLSWLDAGYSRLLQPYLDANGYDGYTVKVTTPVPDIDTAEIDLKRVDAGVSSKTLGPNEIRVLLGRPEATDEELLAIEDFYTRQSPTVPQFNFSAGVATSAEADEIPDKSTDGFLKVGNKLADDTIAALELL